MLSSVVIVALLALSGPIFAKSADDGCTISKLADVEAVTANCYDVVVKDLEIDAGKTLELSLKSGANLTFQGTITFGYAEWAGPVISIKGNALKVQGAEFDHLIDGRGSNWWDGLGAKGGKSKPVLMKIEATGGSHFKNVHLKDCPQACVGIENSDSIALSYWDIDCINGNPVNGKDVALDTDGFYITDSANIILLNSTVRNQDDCVSLNQGVNMSISNLYCYGGNGLALEAGFVNTEGPYKNTIADSSFEHIMILDAKTGIRVRTVSDAGEGKISNIYFRNIKMASIKEYGVLVEQDIVNGISTGKTNNNIPIDRLNMDNITGTLAGGQSKLANILCDPNDGCSTWYWNGFGFSGYGLPSTCNFLPEGFACAY